MLIAARFYLALRVVFFSDQNPNVKADLDPGPGPYDSFKSPDEVSLFQKVAAVRDVSGDVGMKPHPVFSFF